MLRIWGALFILEKSERHKDSKGRFVKKEKMGDPVEREAQNGMDSKT